MLTAFEFLVKSRKAIVTTVTVIGIVVVNIIGTLKGLAPENINVLVLGMVASCWKLVDTIASEDNAQRKFLQDVEVIHVGPEGAETSVGNKNAN